MTEQNLHACNKGPSGGQKINPDRLYTVSEIFIWVSQYCTKQVLLVKDWSHGAVPENYDGDIVIQLTHTAESPLY